MKKIAVAIHGNENVDFGSYTNHLSMIAAASSSYKLKLVTTRGIRIAQARNAIVKKARELKCDYLFSLDTDHLVQKNIISMLMESMSVASCVSGLVCRRKDTMDQVGYLRQGEKYVKIQMIPNTSVYSVDVCAFGCTLLKMSVFNDISEPFFLDETRTKDDGSVFCVRSDVAFCGKLRAKGHTIMIDTRASVGHVSEPVVVWPWNCNKIKDLNEKNILGLQYS